MDGPASHVGGGGGQRGRAGRGSRGGHGGACKPRLPACQRTRAPPGVGTDGRPPKPFLPSPTRTRSSSLSPHVDSLFRRHARTRPPRPPRRTVQRCRPSPPSPPGVLSLSRPTSPSPHLSAPPAIGRPRPRWPTRPPAAEACILDLLHPGHRRQRPVGKVTGGGARQGRGERAREKGESACTHARTWPCCVLFHLPPPSSHPPFRRLNLLPLCRAACVFVFLSMLPAPARAPVWVAAWRLLLVHPHGPRCLHAPLPRLSSRCTRRRPSALGAACLRARPLPPSGTKCPFCTPHTGCCPCALLPIAAA